MRLGFTGTRNGMTPQQKGVLRYYLKQTTELHNGWCYGADEECLLMYDVMVDTMSFPDRCSIVAHPPTKKSGMTRFKPLHVDVVWRDPFDYLVRDENIVIECERLVATPKGMMEEMRSGTWATVRRARKYHRNHTIILPTGFCRLVHYDTQGRMYEASAVGLEQLG